MSLVLVLFFVKWQWGKRVLFASAINTNISVSYISKEGYK